MGKQIEELARFVAETRGADIPEAVRRHARLVLLDTLGVILAGSERPEVRQLRERLSGGGAATVYARPWPRRDARTAALLNGIAGRAIELCEGYRLASGQAAVQVLPGLLAVAEESGGSGADILAALVVGYDVAARLALAFTPRPLAHQNGQVSLLGAVAAAARLRGFDAAGVSLAMRLAATLLLTPSYTGAVAGATALNVAGGCSGQAAALAPDLALAGFTAEADAIEAALASMVGAGFDADRLPEQIGERWEITRNYFRLYACCNPIHPALDCLAEILDEVRPAADAVARIEVATYRFAAVMREPEPANFFASKYSLPHAAATMVVRGAADHRALDDSALADPAIAALRRRVGIVEDPQMTALLPRLRPARVTVVLRDGRSISRARDSHRGDFAQPFAEAELRGKFRDLAGTVLTGDGVAAVEDAVMRCEEWPSVAVLTELLRRHAA